MSNSPLKQGNFSVLLKYILFLYKNTYEMTSSQLETNSQFKKIGKFYEYIIYTKLLVTILILIIAATTKFNNHTTTTTTTTTTNNNNNNNNNNNSVFAWICGRSLCWCCRFESRQVQ